MASRVTQKHLAQLAGVSINTVSRALRNDPRLSKATRDRIVNLAQDHGYQPDPALAALVAYRMKERPVDEQATLALLVNWRRAGNWLRSVSANQLLSGIRVAGASLGYSLEVFSLQESDSAPQHLLKTLQYRGIRGVILAPPELQGKEMDKDSLFWPRLDWSPFSVVALEPVSFFPHVHYVAPNHFSAMELVWRHLHQQGFRRPGLALRKEVAERVRHRWIAANYTEQLRLPKGSRVPPLIVEPHSSKESLQLQGWIREQSPDVIIGNSYGGFVLPALSSLGLEREISYACLSLCDRTFSGPGVDQNRQLIGEAAVTILHSLMLQNKRGEQPDISGTLIEGTWR